MTILGVHTVHELRNLWDLYSFELQAMNAALGDAWHEWHAADPQGLAAFNVDYARVSQAVSGTGDMVDRLIAAAKEDNGGTGEDYTPAIDPWGLTQGDQFNVLAAAFATGDPNGSTVPGPGGFNDLDKRFRASPVGPRYAPSYKGIPKPDAPDFDLWLYQLTDTAAKQIEKGAQFASNRGLYVLVGAAAGVGLLLYLRR